MNKYPETRRMEISLAGPEDAEAILELVNVVQPHIPWSMDDLAWQHFDGPAGESNLYVLRSDDALVSLYAAVPKKMAISGTSSTAYMIQDVMTHPDYRGRGFLHHLAERCSADLMDQNSLGYTFPNQLSENSFRRRRWTELMAVPLRWRAVSGPVDDEAPEGIEPVSAAFDDTATRIWEDSGLPLGVNRDAEFLNWRYGRPGTEYHRFLVGGDAGYVILKIYEGKNGITAHILDLVVRRNALESVKSSLQFCVGFAAQNGAQHLTAWLPANHPYAPFFDAAGLSLVRGVERTVFVFGCPETLTRSSTVEAWHITQGDSDVY